MNLRQLLLLSTIALSSCLASCVNAPASTPAADRASAAQITVLYDAFGRDPALKQDWGYAALVEVGGRSILFDTGNNPEVLAQNAKAKNVDLSKVDFVVMSHRHGDHMGGMNYLLSVNPKVKIYAPKEGFGVFGGDLPSGFYRRDETLPAEQRYYGGEPPPLLRFGSAWPQANITLVDKTIQIAPGIHLIALVSDKVGTLELRELSLVIDTPDGAVVVVGCSHPGIDKIAQAAAAINPKISLIAGGFHLVVAKDPEIASVITALRDTYHVGSVAPGHCTGEATFAALKQAFGEHYLYAGLGSSLTLGATPRSVASAGVATPAALNESDLASYRSLLAASDDDRHDHAVAHAH